MRHSPKAYLWDVISAISAIQAFTRGKSLQEFQENLLLHSGVERQFEIIGEALTQLRRLDPALASRVPDMQRAIALRNILIHGYVVVRLDEVWKSIQDDLPTMREAVQQLFDE